MESEVAHDPAVSQMIVENERISPILVRTRGTYQSRKERIECRAIGPIERVTTFVEDFDRGVHRVDVVIRTDVSVAVGRLTTASALCQVHPLKCD